MGLPAYQLPEEPALAPKVQRNSTFISVDEYLRREANAEFKSEYVDGQVRAMAGAGFNHNLVSVNLTVALGIGLRGKGCTPLTSDQRVHVKNRSSFLYPDASVLCGKPEFLPKKKPEILLNPTVLVEVLSASTRNFDWGEKFFLYRQIPSLQQYLILDSERVYAELYTRQAATGHWLLTETANPAAVLDLSSVGAQLPLTEVYAGVELPTQRASR